MFGLTQSEWQDLVLSVNVRRQNRRLTPHQTARLLNRAVAAADLGTVAKALNFSDQTTFKNILALTNLPTGTEPLVEWGARRGSIGMKAASLLMRLKEPSKIREAITAAVEHNLTKEEVRQLVQAHERSGKSVKDCIQEALRTRPHIERHELILGSFVSERAKLTVSGLGDAGASRKLKVLLASNFPDVVAQSVRVTGDRFSIMLNENGGRTLRESIHPETVEQCVTRLFEQVIVAN